MPVNPSQTRTWTNSTPAAGTFFEAEFNRIYANTNALQAEKAELAGSSGQDFSANNLSVSGNFATLLKAVLGAEVTDFIKMLFGGNEMAVIRVNSSGEIEKASNARWNGTNYILGYEGSVGAQAAVLQTWKSNGEIWQQSFAGTAGDTISNWNGNGNGAIIINPQSVINQGINRTSDGSESHNFFSDGAAGTIISAQFNRESGANGNFNIANRGSGQLRFLGTDLATIAAFFDSSLNLNLNQNLVMAAGKSISNYFIGIDPNPTSVGTSTPFAVTGLPSGKYIVIAYCRYIANSGGAARGVICREGSTLGAGTVRGQHGSNVGSVSDQRYGALVAVFPTNITAFNFDISSVNELVYNYAYWRIG